MGGARETASLWFHLTSPYGRLRSKASWNRGSFSHRLAGLLRMPFFWHDTFGRYFNRYVGCPMRGHRHVAHIQDNDSSLTRYCFKCEQRLPKDHP